MITKKACKLDQTFIYISFVKIQYERYVP